MRQASVTLGRWIRRAGWAVGLLAVLYLGGDLLFPGAAGPVSETSSFAATSAVSGGAAPALPRSETSSSITMPAPDEALPLQGAEPTPTYVSELAPAVTLAPRPAAALPAAGAERGGSALWPKLAGLALALMGGLFIYTALAFRASESR